MSNVNYALPGIEHGLVTLDTVTTDDVAKARSYVSRLGHDDLAAMLGVDDEGLADGILRGIWTVPA